jgi:hypothetical protein
MTDTRAEIIARLNATHVRMHYHAGLLIAVAADGVPLDLSRFTAADRRAMEVLCGKAILYSPDYFSYQ